MKDMGAEMGMWAVRALVIEAEVDETTSLTVLRDRVQRLPDDVIDGLADGPWLAGLEDAEGLAVVLDASESTTYHEAAIAEVKEAIAATATEIFFGGDHRERCHFLDSAGQRWIMTGGMAPGGPPTGSCYAIGMLAEVGISVEPISTPTSKLCCPKCSGTNQLASIEAIEGYCQIVVDNDGWSFGGHTDVDWDSTRTAGWVCRSCGWATTNATWIEQF